METLRIISRCIDNAKTWWPHLFVDDVDIPYLSKRERENRRRVYGVHSFIPDAADTYQGDARLLAQQPNFTPSLRGPLRWEQIMSRSDETGEWSFL